MNLSSLNRLKRFGRVPVPSPERCELCGVAIGIEHDHLVEPATRKLLCGCHGCSLLFPPRAGTKFVRVPREVKSLPGLKLADQQWASFLLPIELAFFFHSSHTRSLVAIYPSPAGPTETELPPDSWEGFIETNPSLRGMEPDVEALLVHRSAVRKDYFLVPIDECYKLVGLLRLKWKGFSGGTEVWNAIETFFNGLKSRARPWPEEAYARA